MNRGIPLKISSSYPKQGNKKKAAIVLGASINGLGIIRALGRCKIKVYAFYKNPGIEIGCKSKYSIPILYNSKKDLLSKLITVSELEKTNPILFCSSDEMVSFVLENNNYLKKFFSYNFGNIDLIKILLDKNEYNRLLKKNTIPYPKTLYPKEYDSHEKMLEEIESMLFPVLAKPAITFKNAGTAYEKNIVFQSFSDIKKFIKQNQESLDEIIFQEIIPHRDDDIYYCTGYSDRQGNIKALFSVHKLRCYHPEFGISSFTVSQQLPEVRRLVISYLRKLQYKGLFDIEFIYDSRDSQYKLIEINPRTTLSNSHSESCGINIPYITYCDLQGIEYNQKQEQKDAIYWIYFWIDSGSFYRKLKKKQITPIEWISSILKARSFAVWAKDDIKPFLVFIFKSLANLMGI
ncbi:MAG: hypothetical protein PVI26_09020 [Chitinispirillia bacterium]|jgi:predicted ATP-grasp superfamily ATP-dependent carboligase